MGWIAPERSRRRSNTAKHSWSYQQAGHERGRHYLFVSHDGFGVGHVRRSCVLAAAVLDVEPLSTATIVTGVRHVPGFLGGPRVSVVRVPFEQAPGSRQDVFSTVIRACRPDVVVVDRHPYGTAGELRAGLEDARAGGAVLVLGLSDVLDEPEAVALELSGTGWSDVPELFDRVLVYGSAAFCDHQREYGLPLSPTYCGWVVAPAERRTVDPHLLVVTAGGGGDGGDTFRLGLAALEHLDAWHGVLVAGPDADQLALRRQAMQSPAQSRVALRADVAGCGELVSAAGAVVQMAGYNSTYEALAAGCRPVLVPRRRPGREQLIRATRLAALGLADVLSEDAGPWELVSLLDRPRQLTSDQSERAGIDCDGAHRAASILVQLAGPQRTGLVEFDEVDRIQARAS